MLGIDVGTTGAKALLIDDKGTVRGKGHMAYGVRILPGGRVEQDARDWWSALVHAVRTASAKIEDKEEIAAISLSTQGAAMLPVDKDNEPMYPAMTCTDTRGLAEKEELKSKLGQEYFYKTTGLNLSPSLDAVKILWLSRHEKDIFEKAYSFISTLEYINCKLTGENVIDPSNAAARQLMDISSLEWDKGILQAIGIEKHRLPRIIPTGVRIGKLSRKAADELGLSTSVKVYNGAYNRYCVSLGAGAVREGEAVLSMNTDWAMLGITSKPLFSSLYISPGPHPMKGLWGALASIPVSGAALDWYLRGFTDKDCKKVNAEAEKRIEKTKNLFFYPYFTGAWLPFRNENAKAVLLGIGLDHDRYDVARAVMEGVALQVKRVIHEYHANGCEIHTLRILNGTGKNGLWTSLISTITGCAHNRVEEEDAACIGAAAIAAVGKGIFEDYVAAVKAMVKSTKTIEADRALADYYLDKYEKYFKTWEQVSKCFR